MEKIKKEKTINKNIKIILILFLIILFLTTGYAFAKNMAQIMINSKTEVAEPILIVENDSCIEISSPNKRGVYNFKIKNYDENDKITDVNLQYKIEIKSKSEDLRFKLYEKTDEIKLTNNQTDYISISNNKKEERQYSLTIYYDENDVEKVEDIIDQVQLKIHSEQIKG